MRINTRIKVLRSLVTVAGQRPFSSISERDRMKIIYNDVVKNSTDALLEKAEQCRVIAKAQHEMAEAQHESATLQSENAERQKVIATQQHSAATELDVKATKLATLGDALVDKAVEVHGWTGFR
jgi:c-di-GMP-binding flagellar brake protein YcgR